MLESLENFGNENAEKREETETREMATKGMSHIRGNRGKYEA
jgi:hypothetical protein